MTDRGAMDTAVAPLDALVVADDLTGAADTAVAFAAAGLPTEVTFAGHRPQGRPRVLALDTDSRRDGPDPAARSVAAAVRSAPPARVVMKKIDSTLRGNVGAETMAALRALGRSIALCAPAFPGAGRHTRGGVQSAMGVEVGDVRACFAGLEVDLVPLEAVRAGEAGDALTRSVARGAEVVVVDAESDEDLREIVSVGAGLDGVLWVGSGGLGAALAAATSPVRAPAPQAVPSRVGGPALIVVGSATPVAAAQAGSLAAAGATEVLAPAGDLLDRGVSGQWPGRAAAALRAGHDVVVRVGEGERIVAGRGRAVVEALGAALAPVVEQAEPAVLVATGGETALTLSQALGCHGLEVCAELEPGVVYSRLTGGPGLPLVTKAGAFGDEGSLVRALGILRAGANYQQERV